MAEGVCGEYEGVELPDPGVAQGFAQARIEALPSDASMLEMYGTIMSVWTRKPGPLTPARVSSSAITML